MNVLRSLHAFATAAALALILTILGSPSGQRVLGQSDTTKLTTVLAELAQSVPQDQPGVNTAQTTAPTRPLALESLPKSVQDAVRGRHMRMNERNEVQVSILVTAVSDENTRALAAAGVTVEISDAARRRIQARIPVSRLQAVAALPFVTFIRLPAYARRHTGSVTSEGDTILQAAAARKQFALDGTGVRVGVISDGLKGIFATNCTTCGGVAGGPISTGDLPDSTGTRNSAGVLKSSSGGINGQTFPSSGDLEGLPPISPPCGFSGAGAEGTALLEIVHDLAPGAQLSFANGDTDASFQQAVNALASSNDIVLDDLGFLGEPYDGTSGVSSNTAAALNNNANPIRAYVTSVGNEADEHYYGTYVDSGIDGTTVQGITNAGHLHLFQASTDTTDVLGLGAQPYNVIVLPTNAEVVIFLTWDDRFGASGNNYDLYLVKQSSGQVVARSTDRQTGSQDPLEFIDYKNNGAQDTFRIIVQNVGNAAQAKHLNIFSFAPECASAAPKALAPPRHERHNYNTATRSVSAQADSGGSPVSVISVGAICSASAGAAAVFPVASPNESCTDTSHGTIEYFSSEGPTIDGRTKPDVSAIDGVAVTGAGRFENPFFGTSAASPHIGGIAALLLQSAPCLLNGGAGALDAAAARARLRNLIISNADPLSSSPPDNTFGTGRANALTSVQQTLPVLKGPSQITIGGNTSVGATLTGSLLGWSDPNSCQVNRLSWTGGCGTSPGSVMTCPFGTTQVSVQASNNGVAFSSAVDMQVTVTTFAVATSPSSATVSAGQSASYTATLTAAGGAFGSPVTLGCGNLPAGTSCTFNPPTVVPDSRSASSTLTISTTAASRTSAASRAGRGSPELLRRANAMSNGEWGWGPTSSDKRWAVLWAAVMALLLVSLGAARTARQLSAGFTLLVAFVTLSVAVQIGCSGDSSPPPSSGNGPVVSLAPTSLTFGTQTVQTTSPTQTVTLSNTGSAALTINAAGVTSVGSTASADFVLTNSCGISVAAGGNCSLAVAFTPTAVGTRTGTLSISDNAAGSPQTVALSGVGQAAPAGSATPPGTYQVAVTGASGTLVQSSTVTLVVQ